MVLLSFSLRLHHIRMVCLLSGCWNTCYESMVEETMDSTPHFPTSRVNVRDWRRNFNYVPRHCGMQGWVDYLNLPWGKTTRLINSGHGDWVRIDLSNEKRLGEMRLELSVALGLNNNYEPVGVAAWVFSAIRRLGGWLIHTTLKTSDGCAWPVAHAKPSAEVYQIMKCICNKGHDRQHTASFVGIKIQKEVLRTKEFEVSKGIAEGGVLWRTLSGWKNHLFFPLV